MHVIVRRIKELKIILTPPSLQGNVDRWELLASFRFIYQTEFLLDSFLHSVIGRREPPKSLTVNPNGAPLMNPHCCYLTSLYCCPTTACVNVIGISLTTYFLDDG
ncbi:hypothetical protein CEXT_592901 [Caerostris extrusa]|uniref:Uncharacterized protein n=1 Tax=Caerostris extrusa TaxID=172846 RepID=A0AAV4PTA9_CAEEX|nr:hypothetical protein CEXT_592901 [Caerostris extrusa]